MNVNPYRTPLTPSTTDQGASSPGNSFAFWTVGPLTGASVGLVHVTASVAAWAMHGYPDFLWRSGESAFFFAIVLSMGGAMVGVPYAYVLAICSRAFQCCIRARVHFWIATLASFVVSYGMADLSLRRLELSSPYPILLVIVGIAFLAAMVTAKRKVRANPE